MINLINGEISYIYGDIYVKTDYNKKNDVWLLTVGDCDGDAPYFDPEYSYYRYDFFDYISDFLDKNDRCLVSFQSDAEMERFFSFVDFKQWSNKKNNLQDV